MKTVIKHIMNGIENKTFASCHKCNFKEGTVYVRADAENRFKEIGWSKDENGWICQWCKEEADESPRQGK